MVRAQLFLLLLLSSSNLLFGASPPPAHAVDGSSAKSKKPEGSNHPGAKNVFDGEEEFAQDRALNFLRGSVWKGSCRPYTAGTSFFYSRLTYALTIDGEFKEITQFFRDFECQREFDRKEDTGTFSVRFDRNEPRVLQFTTEKRAFTYFDSSAVAKANNKKLFGYEDWKAGEAKFLPQKDFDRYVRSKDTYLTIRLDVDRGRLHISSGYSNRMPTDLRMGSSVSEFSKQ